MRIGQCQYSWKRRREDGKLPINGTLNLSLSTYFGVENNLQLCIGFASNAVIHLLHKLELRYHSMNYS